jgi:hypothetical protein
VPVSQDRITWLPGVTPAGKPYLFTISFRTAIFISFALKRKARNIAPSSPVSSGIVTTAGLIHSPAGNDSFFPDKKHMTRGLQKKTGGGQG